METSKQEAVDILANWNEAVSRHAEGIEGEPDNRLHAAAQFIGRRVLIDGVFGDDEPQGALCVLVENVELVDDQIRFATQVQSEPPIPFSTTVGVATSGPRIVHVIADVS